MSLLLLQGQIFFDAQLCTASKFNFDRRFLESFCADFESWNFKKSNFHNRFWFINFPRSRCDSFRRAKSAKLWSWRRKWGPNICFQDPPVRTVIIGLGNLLRKLWKKRVIKGIGWTNKATHFWQIRLSVLLTDFGSIYTWKSVQHGFCAKNRLDKSLHIRFSSDCKES